MNVIYFVERFLLTQEVAVVVIIYFLCLFLSLSQVDFSRMMMKTTEIVLLTRQQLTKSFPHGLICLMAILICQGSKPGLECTPNASKEPRRMLEITTPHFQQFKLLLCNLRVLNIYRICCVVKCWRLKYNQACANHTSNGKYP